MSEFHERIRILVDKFGGITSFAKLVDLPTSNIDVYLPRSGKKPTKPSIEKVAKIVKGTGCDANWLITGEGSPYPDIPQLTDSIPKSKLTKLSSDKQKLLEKFFEVLAEHDSEILHLRLLELQINEILNSYKEVK